MHTSAVKFSDVGGCEDTLEEISKLLLHLQHPEIFSRLGVHPPQGFLLHGPPGCGKTLMAHAIAGVRGGAGEEMEREVGGGDENGTPAGGGLVKNEIILH